MTRYIGVDLHTNSFTVCILQEDQDEIIQTFPLQQGGLEKFIKTLRASDEVALEATGNASHFCRNISAFVKRVVVIAPWKFEVIRRSVALLRKSDESKITLYFMIFNKF